VNGLISWVEFDATAKDGCQLLRRIDQSGRESVEDAEIQSSRLFLLPKPPRLECRLICDVEAGDERTAEEARQRAQPVKIEAVGALRAGGANAMQIDVNIAGMQRHSFPIRLQAFDVFVVQQRAELAQRPAQSGAWIVRELPQQFAQGVAPLWRPLDGQKREQRAGLPRLRERDEIAGAADFEFPQQLYLKLCAHGRNMHALRSIDQRMLEVASAAPPFHSIELDSDVGERHLAMFSLTPIAPDLDPERVAFIASFVDLAIPARQYGRRLWKRFLAGPVVPGQRDPILAIDVQHEVGRLASAAECNPLRACGDDGIDAGALRQFWGRQLLTRTARASGSQGEDDENSAH
jgi:hypothetical protein